MMTFFAGNVSHRVLVHGSILLLCQADRLKAFAIYFKTFFSEGNIKEGLMTILKLSLSVSYLDS